MKFSSFSKILHGKFAKEFLRCSEYSPTALSLQTFLSFGQTAKAVDSFSFLRKELPVRLANIMQEIHLLPDKLNETSYVKLVSALYEKSFCELLDYEHSESNESTVNAFTNCIANIRDRHSNVVETMAQGVMEVKERAGIDASTDNQLQYFLDRFYLNRISIRMLINQHVTLFGSERNNDREFVGMIDPDTNILAVMNDAYHNASHLCSQQYGSVPPLRVTVIDRVTSPTKSTKENTSLGGKNGSYSRRQLQQQQQLEKIHRHYQDYKQVQCLSQNDIDDCIKKKLVLMTYVPAHLYHILFEIMKNAMRAIVEYHHNSDKLPPIKVLICGADENVTIKTFDNGGGIPRSLLDHVFKYTFTTAAAQLGEVHDGSSPMAGYGYGLPISRLYARYLNGDLTLSSIEGFGTDAILYLRRRPSEADELLPIFNRTSARHYGAGGIPAADWSNPDYTSGLYTILKSPNSSNP